MKSTRAMQEISYILDDLDYAEFYVKEARNKLKRLQIDETAQGSIFSPPVSSKNPDSKNKSTKKGKPSKSSS